VFTDAGNVWNSDPNPTFEGSDVFNSEFLKELGIGSGVGLRIDVQGFVIRFDLAAPFHDPALPEGERWDFQYDEPILNFAIGYSF
jgi:outer membrane protein assembly factor BamA